MGNKIVLSLVFTLSGFLFFLNLFGAVNMERIEIFGISFILFGIISVFSNIGKNKRGLLFLSSCLFILGCIITFVHNSEIYNYQEITFSAVLVIIGSGFLILYFDNPNVKAFMYSSILLLTFGMLTVHKSNLFGIAPIANRYCNSLLNVWPIFIIISLVLILAKRNQPSNIK